MSLWLERFDDVTLPLIEAQQDIGAIGTRTSYTNLPGGGGYDNYGNDQAPRGVYSLPASGELMGETQAEVLADADALRAKRGRRAKLYARVDDNSVRWVWARLRDVRITRRPEHVLFLPVDLQFDITSPVWYGTTHGADWEWNDGTLWDSGAAWNQATNDVFPLAWDDFNIFTVVNDGNATIDNAILTVTAGAAAVTAFGVVSEDADGVDQADWEWTGTLAAGQSLVIDAGKQSIENNGTGAYANLTFNAGHALPGWFRLDPGSTSLVISFVSTADATLTVTFADGFE